MSSFTSRYNAKRDAKLFSMGLDILAGENVKADGPTKERALERVIQVAKEKIRGLYGTSRKLREYSARATEAYDHNDRVDREIKAEEAERGRAYLKVLNEIYEKTKLRGEPIGEIWYDELQAYRKESAFETALCSEIINYGTPSEPTKVKNFVPPKELAAMVDRAKASASEVV